MHAPALRSEERIGLIAALLAHGALVAWLVWQPAPAPLPPPERMTVTLSEDVGLSATTPNPAPEAAPDKGPELGEAAPAPQPQPAPAPAPAAPKPQPAPAKPAPQPQPAKPQPTPAKASPSSFERAFAKTAPAKAGASSFDNAFAKGVPGAAGRSTAPNAAPAAAFGPQQQGALRAAIFRQLKPHWSAPQGIDAEKLVTVVRFRLDKSGRLVGEPVQVSQSGQTPANAAQAGRHFEQAVRAIKLAQPFILPPDLYPYWQTVTSTFDRKLSQ